MTGARLSKEEQSQVASYLEQNLETPVAIEVWTRRESPLIRTDRDPCTHCEDVVAVARQLASLHPGLSVTLYDLDRHAQRAQEAGIERPPVTVLRGVQGCEFRFTGLWLGLLFPAMLDAIALLSLGAAHVAEETWEKLASLQTDVTLEVMGAPYDAYSAHMLRLAAAFAAESKHVRASFIQIAEFPMLASARAVDEIPVVLIDNRRHLGVWDEPELAEQIRRTASGDDGSVSRETIASTPFYTDDEIARLAAESGQEPPPQTASGLYVPGR